VDFVAVMEQVIALLRQRGRVTYRMLQLQFTLDDEQLAALKDELLYSQPGAVYVSREGYFSPSVVANNSLTILPDSRCGR